MSMKPSRNLSVFAFDPNVASKFANKRIKTLTISLPWEMEKQDDDVPFVGPRGDYIEVVDYDPSSGAFYAPVNLNEARLRANDGLEPAVDNPQFHQQMVYAVAMNTIAVFEKALGRVALWAPRQWNPSKGPIDPAREFVQRLRIYPHALREANAYYDPSKKALLFGYFHVGPEHKSMLPGSTVFTCLSHDIIVHETCHALLDGMHPYFAESTNMDVLALHEGFSDIVAILQHFSHPEVLEDQIAKTGGDLERQSLLGALAQEFGEALGRGHALRDALGGMVNGEWKAKDPDNRALEHTQNPHARGSILVAAVFRTFLSIYRERVADLLRIASGGRGILPAGELDPDLRKRLAGEAAKSARHVLQMCIRALDYCPPVDVSLGDYFRALVTADHDLYPEDQFGYRAAMIEAFTAWGIRPEGAQIVTENTLLWPTFEEACADHNVDLRDFAEDFGTLVNAPKTSKENIGATSIAPATHGKKMSEALDRVAEDIRKALSEEIDSRISKKWRRTPGRLTQEVVLSRNLLELGLAADRKVEHLVRHFYGELFWAMIHNHKHDDLYDLIGIDLSDDAPKSINTSKFTGRPALQVHSVRMANRVGDRGQVEREYVVELVQSRAGYFDPEDQMLADAGKLEKNRDFAARSGATLLIDARSFQIRRIIKTRGAVSDDVVMTKHRAFQMDRAMRVRTAFDGLPEKPDKSAAFAALHRSAEQGDVS